jgi:hypothetical protein
MDFVSHGIQASLEISDDFQKFSPELILYSVGKRENEVEIRTKF